MALICLCEGVSERKVARAIDHGATTVDAVGEACRAGTGCGTCVKAIDDMIVARVSVEPAAAWAIA